MILWDFKRCTNDALIASTVENKEYVVEKKYNEVFGSLFHFSWNFTEMKLNQQRHVETACTSCWDPFLLNFLPHFQPTRMKTVSSSY